MANPQERGALRGARIPRSDFQGPDEDGNPRLIQSGAGDLHPGVGMLKVWRLLEAHRDREVGGRHVGPAVPPSLLTRGRSFVGGVELHGGPQRCEPEGGGGVDARPEGGGGEGGGVVRAVGALCVGVEEDALDAREVVDSSLREESEGGDGQVDVDSVLEEQPQIGHRHRPLRQLSQGVVDGYIGRQIPPQSLVELATTVRVVVEKRVGIALLQSWRLEARVRAKLIRSRETGESGRKGGREGGREEGREGGGRVHQQLPSQLSQQQSPSPSLASSPPHRPRTPHPRRRAASGDSLVGERRETCSRG